MFNSPLPREKFPDALTFEQIVGQAAEEGRGEPWRDRYSLLELDADQHRLVASFTRDMNVLCMTGPWCGDCALQGAAMQRISEANPDRIHLRFLNRNDHAELQTQFPVNGGFRVPVTFFMSEDFHAVSIFADRSLSRYRSIARKAFGEDAPVVAAHPENPVREVLNETLLEFERVHLILRLSTRLRQAHGD